MGTIDMSQVAGFKAVDAEGNELGVVSMSELTASICEQVLQTIAMRNQANTLEQPGLMSAASTLAAGNDAFENELPEQTDLKWARALDASGNPILISKESLASVVGGLLVYPWGEWCTDCNDVRRETTIALQASDCRNIPDGFIGVGLLKSHALRNGEYVIQYLRGLNNGLLYTRYSVSNESWEAWSIIEIKTLQ